MKKSEKERIVHIYSEWGHRSGLKFEKVIARIQTYSEAVANISDDQFKARITRTDRMTVIEPELILAVVSAFTEGLRKNERCTLEEAMEFASLARLPHNQLGELKQFFPTSEYQQAEDVPSPKENAHNTEGHISNQPSPLPAIAERPPDDFVGREEALKKISEALLKGQSTAITALQGMGGIGKTALAQMLAERLKSHFSGGIFWADLAGHNGSAEPILRAWGAVCGADLSQEPDRNVLAQLVRGLLAQRQQQYGPLLAVVDDVRTEPAWLSTAGILRQTLPADTPLLLTARNEGLTEELADYTWRVDLLTQNESWTLLTKRVRNEALLQPIETVHQLLAALGYLPLAIRLAAGYLNRRGNKPNFQLVAFVQRVKTAAAKILDTPHTAGLKATFQISYEALEDTEQRVFRYLSVYSDPLLTVDHMAGLLAMDADSVEDLLDILVEAAMLDRDRKIPGHYRLHPLLRQYSYELLQECGEGAALHREAATYLRNIAEERDASPEERLEEVDQWQRAEEWETFVECASALVGSLNRVGYWPEIDERLAQAQSALIHLTKEVVHGLDVVLLQCRGSIANSQARWNDAIDYFEQSLKMFGQLGDTHGMALTYNNLGNAYQSKGEWDKAIGYYEQSLEAKEQVGDIQGRAQTYNNLGAVYKSRGEWDKAIGYYEQFLETKEQAGDIHDITSVYNNLGNAYQSKGEWDKAIGYYEQSLEAKKQVGDIHGWAQTYNNLGLVYKSKGEWDKAIGYYEQSLETFEQVGDIHGIAQTYNNLGSVYSDKGEWDKAIGYYEQSLEAKKQVGDIHGWAIAYNNLGLVYQSKGEWDKAISYYEQSLRTFEQVGNTHAMALTYNSLGTAYKSKGEWDKAISYYEQSLQIKKQIGDIHGIAQTYNNLGLVYQSKGEWDKAISYYEQSLETKKQMGDIHGMAKTRANLGNVYQSRGEWDKAINYYEQSLIVEEQVGDIQAIALTYNNLGNVYQSRGEWDKAIGYYKQSLEIKKQVGDIHGKASIYNNLGLVYKSKGEWGKAIGYYEQSLETKEKVGDIHGRAIAYNNLGLVYQAIGEWDKAIDYYQQSLEIFEQVGDIYTMAQTRGNLGNIYSDKGDWGKAIGYYEQSLKTFEQLGDILGVAKIYNNLGAIYSDKGEWSKAISYYQQDLKFSEQMGDIHGMAQTRAALGNVYSDKGEWDKAISHYEQSLETFNQMGAIRAMAQTYDNLGLVYADKEEWNKAIDCYEQALEMYEQIDDIHSMANTWMDIGTLLLKQNRYEDAQPSFAQAYIIFLEMNAPEIENAGADLAEACGSEEAAKAYFKEYMATDQDISEMDVNTVAGNEEENDKS